MLSRGVPEYRFVVQVAFGRSEPKARVYALDMHWASVHAHQQIVCCPLFASKTVFGRIWFPNERKSSKFFQRESNGSNGSKFFKFQLQARRWESAKRTLRRLLVEWLRQSQQISRLLAVGQSKTHNEFRNWPSFLHQFYSLKVLLFVQSTSRRTLRPCSKAF